MCKDIERPMILICILIYLSIPNYVSKARIPFRCILEEKITKNIELKNPTKYAIQYRVLKEGHSDFHFKQKKLLIESGKKV